MSKGIEDKLKELWWGQKSQATIYNEAVDRCIRIAERIGLQTNPINPPNVVAGLIIQELKKLKG